MATAKQKQLIRKAMNDLARYQQVLESPEERRDFYKKLHKKATFLPLCTSKQMRTREQSWPIINHATGTLLHPGEEGTPPPSNQLYAPEATKKTIVTHKHTGMVAITREVLEENLAKKGLTRLIRECTNKKLAEELEDIHLFGVANNALADSYANFISKSARQQDGLIERMRSVNLYDCNNGPLTVDRFMEMFAMLPSQYVDTNIRFFINHRAKLALQSDLQARATQLGDSFIGIVPGDKSPSMSIAGVPIVMLPRIPDRWGTQDANKTIGFLCDPKEAMIGHFRNPEFEMWREPRSDNSFLILRMRTGCQWNETDGTVFAEKIGMHPSVGA